MRTGYIDRIYRLEDGEIITEYEENYEMVPEVVTHKHVLDEFNSGSPPKAGMLGDTVEDIEDVLSEELEEEEDEEEGTEEEKRGELLNESTQVNYREYWINMLP